MHADLISEALARAARHDALPVGSSAQTASTFQAFAYLAIWTVAGLALASVVFGLWVLAEHARAKRAGSEPRISPNVDGRGIVVVSLVGVVIALSAAVLVNFFR
ncbi:hypothetical protein ACFVWF_31875 [Rhodococcus qingshengii]|uniref:hypothetical protein n=1 Tax=Rhodococcus qingshengii TaxID=334542 RepID=UPI0036D922C8